MKKNKKQAREAAKNALGANGKAKDTSVESIKDLDMSEFDDEELVITKAERAPLPRKNSEQAAAPTRSGNASMQRQPEQPPQMSVDAALLKPVPGGLQPIIAPKGQVQLNPVVVPVAFVPYSTQNQPLFQSERKQQSRKEASKVPVLEEIKDQPADKKAARAARKKEKAPEFEAVEEKPYKDPLKKAKTKNRVFGAITFIFSLVFFAFLVLNYFSDTIHNDILTLIIGTGDPDIIGGWINFQTTNVIAEIPLFLITAAAVIAFISMILAFVSICTGKGFHLWIAFMLMLIITLVTTLIGALTTFFGDCNVSLNPAEDGGYAWRLVFSSAFLFILGLIFFPRKGRPAEEDDDFLSDLR